MFIIWGFMFIMVELIICVIGVRLYCLILFFEVMSMVVVLLLSLFVLLVVIVLF